MLNRKDVLGVCWRRVGALNVHLVLPGNQDLQGHQTGNEIYIDGY